MKLDELEPDRGDMDVAPLAGAWIEIFLILSRYKFFSVAPLAGAWIEINYIEITAVKNPSLPSRERGLKYIVDVLHDVDNLSLPSRERGLKSDGSCNGKRPCGRSPRGSVD